jgi:hypothetical protein
MLAMQERLQLALDFARMDLDELREGDWLNLREDLETFILGTRAKDRSLWGRVTPETRPIRTAALRQPTPREMSREAFQALQAEVRKMLEVWAPRDEALRQLTTVGSVTVRLGVHPELTFERRGVVTLNDSAPVAALAILGSLLIALPDNILLRCPECDAVFYRNRHQVYCTRKCVNRANARDLRRAKKAAKQAALGADPS